MLPSARFVTALLIALAPLAADAQETPPEVVDWMRAHAISLAGADPALPADDLDALAPVLGDARVIGVGEGTHGTREFFQFRDRLVRWLAARGELDAVLWETALAPTLAKEPMVTDPDATYDFEAAMGGGFWNTEENRALLDALRDHNVTASRPVRFLGADMSDLAGSLAVATSAAERIGGDAQPALAVMADALGGDPAAVCVSADSCYHAWQAMTADQARRLAEGADWLADALEAAGEPWTVTIAARAVGDRVRWFLPFDLMPASTPDTPVAQIEERLGAAQAAARRAADTLAVAFARRDPAWWASVAPVVTALPDGADAYRDSLGRAERFEWDQVARALRARLATGRYGRAPSLVAAADTLVAWLDLVHESLRRPPTDMDFENYREVALGRNVAQIAREVGGNGRVVFAAHNGHVGYNPSITLARTSAGAYARDGLGDDYLAVGTFFGEGSFQAFDRSWRRGADAPRWRAFETTPAPGSFEAALMATGLDAFALDLRRLPASGPVAEWFARPRPTRNIGNSFSPDPPADGVEAEYEDQVVAEGFDVVVFFRQASRAVPTAAEIERGSYDLGR